MVHRKVTLDGAGEAGVDQNGKVTHTPTHTIVICPRDDCQQSLFGKTCHCSIVYAGNFVESPVQR